MHKVPGAHYESAALRKFIHGRTETIRSCSNESIAFAKIMLNSSKSAEEKVKALRAAVDAHKKYTVDVSSVWISLVCYNIYSTFVRKVPIFSSGLAATQSSYSYTAIT